MLCLAANAPAISQKPDADGLDLFEKKIRPILVDSCYKCHSRDSEKIKGGLLLDTSEGLLKGGDTGPAIIAGDPEKSLLIKAVRYTDENLQMPPKGKRLASTQIQDLEAWVRMGAPDPRTNTNQTTKAEVIAARARSHWAFQPIKEPPIPPVQNHRWIRTPVDAFLLAKLESQDLTPSPQADKRTLIRRATFDLIGLPPRPEEVAAFIADKSSAAFARVIDRLLASPQYGERWGRHWLDVARFADTKGYVFEEERRYPYSYTYRDYVIRAFNEDLPYNQFIVQQIAADALPLGEDKRPLAALGYLTLGRRFVNNIHDIIDDRIDVVCRGMMGLTVSCARCHDHKYDPIPTKDYYSLYGVFASSMEPEEEPLLGMQPNSKAHEEYLAEHKKRLDERANFKQSKEAEMSAALRRQAGEYLLAAYDAQQLTNKSETDSLAHKRQLDPGVLHRWMGSLEARGKTNDPIFFPWFAFAAVAEPEFAAKAKELTARFATSTEPFLNPRVAAAFGINSPVNMKEVAECYGKLLVEVDKDWQQTLTNHSAQASSTNTSEISTGLPDKGEEALRQILYAADAPANLPVNEFDRLYDVPTSQKLRELQRKIDELAATHPGAPPRAMALVDKSSPYNVQIFIRGNTDNRGPEVPRQFPEVLAGPNRTPFQKGSGRLELAQAIASPENPLTARVLVNRVWLHHFGAGLVRTPSDFGLRSEPPTHPELLDYLATRFMREGWSIKKLHRLIMLSSVYQQSSDDNPRSNQIDPNNQLVWRMNRQRLDFESLRDSLLATAGKLDLSTGGHAVDITSEPYSTRRTVYGYIDRQNLPGLFRTFDFASPDSTSPQRFFTTVPQQALFLMNSSFVVQQARSLVDRPEFRTLSSPEQRVRFLYEQAFQRDPTREELQLAEEFRRSQQQPEPSAKLVAWQYGYGEFDDVGNRIKHFERLPHSTGTVLQGGASMPDPKLGWVMLTEAGGHAGNDLQHAAIRRWVAPRDGFIRISGSLNHNAEQGDGIRGRVISSQAGELDHWVVHNGEVKTEFERVAVHRGDTIDFLADCYKTVEYDSFTWKATITFVAEGIPSEIWDTEKDFAPSLRLQQKPLTDWEKYAQVLLLADELVFVD